MKITIYELLGLIKEGKAPKRIKFMYKEFEFIKNDEFGDYISEDGVFCETLSGYDIILCLNDEVEITEEKPKHIGKINLCKEEDEYMVDMLNDLADAVNYLLDKEKQNE